MDAHTRLFIDLGANLISYGLSTPDQIMHGLIGYSHHQRDEAMALVEALAASRGIEDARTTDRGLLLNLGATLLAQDLATPATIAANLIDPATPDQGELMSAIYALAAVRKATCR